VCCHIQVCSGWLEAACQDTSPVRGWLPRSGRVVCTPRAYTQHRRHLWGGCTRAGSDWCAAAGTPGALLRRKHPCSKPFQHSCNPDNIAAAALLAACTYFEKSMWGSCGYRARRVQRCTQATTAPRTPVKGWYPARLSFSAERCSVGCASSEFSAATGQAGRTSPQLSPIRGPGCRQG
jgi:hypothetical protein